jgi:hypothetical protein
VPINFFRSWTFHSKRKKRLAILLLFKGQTFTPHFCNWKTNVSQFYFKTFSYNGANICGYYKLIEYSINLSLLNVLSYGAIVQVDVKKVAIFTILDFNKKTSSKLVTVLSVFISLFLIILINLKHFYIARLPEAF